MRCWECKVKLIEEVGLSMLLLYGTLRYRAIANIYSLEVMVALSLVSLVARHIQKSVSGDIEDPPPATSGFYEIYTSYPLLFCVLVVSVDSFASRQDGNSSNGAPLQTSILYVP